MSTFAIITLKTLKMKLLKLVQDRIIIWYTYSEESATRCRYIFHFVRHVFLVIT